MKKFFQKQREILAIFAYVLLIAALIYVVILPLIARINNIRDQIQEESLKQESSSQRLSNLPNVQDQFERLEANQSEVDVLLDKERAVVLIEKLEKLAEQSGNKITIAVQDQSSAAKATSTVKGKGAIDTTLVDGLPSKDYLQLKITLNGNFEAIGKFIKSLESFAYYSDIIGLEIKKDDGEDSRSGNNVGFGVANPFSGGGNKNIISAPVATDLLEAGLDVVFYTK